MTWDQECTETFPSVPFIDDMDVSSPATNVTGASTSDDDTGVAIGSISTSPFSPTSTFVGCFADEETSRIMRLALKDTAMTTQVRELTVQPQHVVGAYECGDFVLSSAHAAVFRCCDLDDFLAPACQGRT